MNETWYRILRRLFDLIILLLFVVILVPDQWYSKATVLEDRPFERTEPLVKQVAMSDISEASPNEVVIVEELSPKVEEVVVVSEVPKTNLVKVEELIVEPQVKDVSTIKDVSSIKEEKSSNSPASPKSAVKKASKPKAVKPAPKDVWWLQVGVFQNQSGADAYIGKLKSAHLPYQSEVLGKLTVLKVGPISEREMPEMTSKLKKAGIPNWVKTRGSK